MTDDSTYNEGNGPIRDGTAMLLGKGERPQPLREMFAARQAKTIDAAEIAKSHPEVADFLRLHTELKHANAAGKELYENLLRDMQVMTIRAESAEAELLRVRLQFDAVQRAYIGIKTHMALTANMAIAGLEVANTELRDAGVQPPPPPAGHATMEAPTLPAGNPLDD